MIQRCRMTLYSRTKENRLVVQIEKTISRKFKPLFSRNKKVYASKEVKENALASEGKLCRRERKPINRYVCHDLSVQKQVAKITFAQLKRKTLQSIIYPAEKNNLWEQAAFWHEVKVV